jgi:hypothetical protein
MLSEMPSDSVNTRLIYHAGTAFAFNPSGMYASVSLHCRGDSISIVNGGPDAPFAFNLEDMMTVQTARALLPKVTRYLFLTVLVSM